MTSVGSSCKIEDFNRVRTAATAFFLDRSSQSQVQVNSPPSVPRHRNEEKPRVEQRTFRDIRSFSSILMMCSTCCYQQKVRDWLLVRLSGLGPQERAATLSATSGETSFSDVSEKLRTRWSDAHLPLYGRHGARKGHAQTHTTSAAAMMTVTIWRSRKTNLESLTTVRTAVTMSTTQLNSGTKSRNLSHKLTIMGCMTETKKFMR